MRISIGDKCVAAATTCSIHVVANLESGKTKDSTGDWDEDEVTGKSWDGSTEALVVIDATDTAALQAFDVFSLVGTLVDLKFEQTEGAKNRTAVTSGKLLSGKAIINDLTMNAPNGQNSTYTMQFKGQGPLVQGGKGPVTQS